MMAQKKHRNRNRQRRNFRLHTLERMEARILMATDFGDAPDENYRTLEENLGASHQILDGYHLGEQIDEEKDGQPNAAANGDDLQGINDDDGVYFHTAIVPGGTAAIEVFASERGMLDAWVDFNGNGDWSHANERIFELQPLAAGGNTLSFTVPNNATHGDTYARFRFSPNGVPDYFGAGPEGEVEDYLVTIERRDNEPTRDFGDAPDASYLTLQANLGASHVVSPNFFLGNAVDAEADGQPSSLGDGDDNHGLNDDDGVTLLSDIQAGAVTQIEVVASADGILDAWVDFDRNGKWDTAAERIFTGQPLVAGANILSFSAPANVNVGQTFARFRFSPNGVTDSFGAGPEGEVEDYLVSIKRNDDERRDYGDAPDVSYLTLQANLGASHVVSPNFFLGNAVDAEADGQPSSLGDGDDNHGLNDDDGVTLLSDIQAGAVTQIEVVASADGILDAWVDFDRNGKWDTAAERIYTGQPLAAGANILSFSAPATVNVGQTFARFRFSPNGVADSFGAGPEGEVEDYLVSIKRNEDERRDYGDAPDASYRTLQASLGASHTLENDYFLGGTVDADVDGQPSSVADGDDLIDDDDDDGVHFLSPIRVGHFTVVDVVASRDGLLDTWVDFNIDGDWDDAGERVFHHQPLAHGLNTLSFAVPFSAVEGRSYARFRFSPHGVADFFGSAGDGEVEDYLVEIQPAIRPDIITIEGRGFSDTNGNGEQDENEEGLSGVEVQLMNEDGNLIATTTTQMDDPQTPEDETGDYYFFDVEPGAYLLAEVLPDGWEPSEPIPLEVAPEDTVVTANFANRRTAEALTPPTVLSVEVNATAIDPADLPNGTQPTSWVQQRSTLQSIRVMFSEEVILGASVIRLTNLGLDANDEPDVAIPINENQLQLTGNVLDIHLESSQLADGVYQLEISPSATDRFGNSLDGNGDGIGNDRFVLQGSAENQFFHLTADFNGDGGVSIFDFSTFAYWFGSVVPAAPSYVDLNGDGGISIFDFSIFASHYGDVIGFPSRNMVADNFMTVPASADSVEAALAEEESEWDVPLDDDGSELAVWTQLARVRHIEIMEQQRISALNEVANDEDPFDLLSIIDDISRDRNSSY